MPMKLRLARVISTGETVKVSVTAKSSNYPLPCGPLGPDGVSPVPQTCFLGPPYRSPKRRKTCLKSETEVLWHTSTGTLGVEFESGGRVVAVPVCGTANRRHPGPRGLAAIFPSKSLSDLPRDRRCRGKRCESGRRSFPRARLKTRHSHAFDFTAALLEKLVEPCKLLENLILELVKTSLKIVKTAPQSINMMFLPIKPSRKFLTLFEKLFARVRKVCKARVEGDLRLGCGSRD